MPERRRSMSGLGAGFGINIDSSEDQITVLAERFRGACIEVDKLRSG